MGQVLHSGGASVTESAVNLGFKRAGKGSYFSELWEFPAKMIGY